MADALATRNGTATPAMGEQTKRQGIGGSVGGLFGLGGFYQPARGTYDTYRRMRQDPTIALARAVATSPIKAAQHSFEAEDGTPDDWVEQTQEAVDRVWKTAVAELLWSIDYGWKGCEIVWGIDPETGMTVPERIKPLAVDWTEIITDPQTGNYLGLRNSGVDLTWGKSLYFGNDVEDQDYYGRSRYENFRENAWAPWLDLLAKQRQYFQKAAGVIPRVRYPDGMGRDASGTEQPNHVLAQKLVASLSAGGAIYYPFEMAPWVEDALKSGAKFDDVSSWAFDFLEVSAGHGAEFLDTARYYDSLKMRGMLVPERAATEGQSGTKAEAVAHADIGVLIAEETHGNIVEAINRQLIDPFLVYNFGVRAKGKVYAVATPLLDSERELGRKILETVLTNPANLDWVTTTLDWDAMVDREGLPKASQIIDPMRTTQVDPAQIVDHLTTTDGAVKQAATDQSLNGAQIASMVTLAQELATGQLPPDVVKNMMKLSFPNANQKIIDQIVSSLAKFTPDAKPGTVPIEKQIAASLSGLYARLNRTKP